ncbi:hypothetical protein [Streptomyces sp. SYSU K217416]
MAAATPAAVGQLVVACLIWLMSPTGDPYGRSPGGFGVLLVMGCLCLAAPVVLPAAGYMQAMLYAAPAAGVGRVLARRLPGPGLLWGLVAAAGLSGLLALPVSLFRGVPYLRAWGWLALFGVLPALSVALFHNRTVTEKAIRKRIALVTGVVVLAVLWAGVIGLATGHLSGYEPPKLSRDDLVGVWHGQHEAGAMRLESGGRAVVSGVPYEAEENRFADPAPRCTGEGTWEHRSATTYQRAGVDVTVTGCAGLGGWEVAGSDARPELFVLVGDPDAGDVRVLRKQ